VTFVVHSFSMMLPLVLRRLTFFSFLAGASAAG
jgi:hypothetical protein